jgi:hypothetical protein
MNWKHCWLSKQVAHDDDKSAAESSIPSQSCNLNMIIGGSSICSEFDRPHKTNHQLA